MLLFFPVPPSLRQAAGPLTENLPNVSAGDPSVLGMDLLLERPSPRGRNVVSPRVLLPQSFGRAGHCSLRVSLSFVCGREAIDDQKGKSCLSCEKWKSLALSRFVSAPS